MITPRILNKILINCYACPYLQNVPAFSHESISICRFIGKQISDETTIPNFCPLPEVKEK